MARTPSMRALRRVVREQVAADRLGIELEELRERRALALSRGELLRRSVALGAAAALAVRVDRAAARPVPRIAIVGGGIAGLTAALTLADRGVRSTVYEASSRLGGRMHSDSPHVPGGNDYFGGQVAEYCGELIDSDHTTIRHLARRFDLPLVDTLQYGPDNGTETYHFFGRYTTDAEIARAFRPVQATLRTQLRAAPYPTLWNRQTPAGLALDRLSVRRWIDRYVPGGHGAALGRLLDGAYAEEFGAETADQSALNLVYALGDQTSGDFSLYGAEDDRYHIAGGNQRLPQRIAEHLEGTGLATIATGKRMNTIALNRDGTVGLWFDGSARPVVVDHAILCTSFAVLRTLDFSRAGFDQRKRAAITELGAGRNAKLQLQFDERYWNRRGRWGVSDGDVYTDFGIQDTWEATLGQPGKKGILVDYTGGDLAGAYRPSRPYSNTGDSHVKRYARAFLTRLERVFPGISRHWNGRAILSTPFLDPNLRCSYSYWRVGQYTAFSGYERVRQGPRGQIHFAGEHCSVDFEGYMEGGAAEGVRAAKEVLAALRHA